MPGVSWGKCWAIPSTVQSTSLLFELHVGLYECQWWLPMPCLDACHVWAVSRPCNYTFFLAGTAFALLWICTMGQEEPEQKSGLGWKTHPGVPGNWFRVPICLSLLPWHCFRSKQACTCWSWVESTFLTSLCHTHWFSNQLRALILLCRTLQFGIPVCVSNCSLPGEDLWACVTTLLLCVPF